jgi:glycosyltransferase involved in cell wall biosynthesis
MADRIQAPTVIVPTLGAGSLAALLSSLGAQSLAHDVIVVDNGTSGDGVR